MHLLEKCNTRKNAWLKSLSFVGVKPVIDVLETVESEDEHDWQHAERFWISYLIFLGCDLTNHDSGGNSGRRQCQHTKDLIRAKALGRKQTPESIEKMKATRKAGWTPELREKMAAINRGRKWSPERKAVHSIALKGRVISEATKQKIRAAQIGKFVSEETRQKIREKRALQTNCKFDHLAKYASLPKPRKKALLSQLETIT